MEIIFGLAPAYLTYFVGTMSPGPANLAIISTAMQHGRPAGIAIALGVMTGSLIWGISSAFGLGQLLIASPALLNVLSIFGGLYLWWLAWRSFRSALNSTPAKLSPMQHTTNDLRKHYLFGLGFHLTNPKALFVWISVISLGFSDGNPDRIIPFLIVLGCGIMGIFVFLTHAIVFSNAAVMNYYLRASRTINFLIAALFSLAGLSLLFRSFTSLALL